MRSLGSFIRSARLESGLTQTQLAERVGTTQSVIARWERDAVEPRLSTLDRIAQAVGAAVRVEFSPPISQEKWASVEANLTLSPAQRSQQLVTAVRFIEDGRRAMRDAARV